MIAQRGDQHLVRRLDLAQHQFIGGLCVLFVRHPLGSARRLGPAHDVVSGAQRLAATQAGDACSVLLKQHVHTRNHQRGDQKVVVVQRIGQHHVARAQGLEHLAHQVVLTSAFALVRPDGGIQRRTGGQADHHNQSGQRESHASRLCAGLGIHGLVLRGIGHGQAGAIDQLDRSTTPQPLGVRLVAEHAPRLAYEPTRHLQWQAHPAITAVRTLQLCRPSATRCAAQPLTAIGRLTAL